MMRDYINGTVGLEKLSGQTHTPAKSLMNLCSARKAIRSTEPFRRNCKIAAG